jgi:hypothetical protein
VGAAADRDRDRRRALTLMRADRDVTRQRAAAFPVDEFNKGVRRSADVGPLRHAVPRRRGACGASPAPPLIKTF